MNREEFHIEQHAVCHISYGHIYLIDKKIETLHAKRFKLFVIKRDGKRKNLSK